MSKVVVAVVGSACDADRQAWDITVHRIPPGVILAGRHPLPDARDLPPDVRSALADWLAEADE